jgi:hypothetical protein
VILRCQIGFQNDSAFPRDVVTINPHYNSDDPQALVDTLKSRIIAQAPSGNSQVFTVKAYNAQKAPPSYPLAVATQGTGSYTTTWPREVALCLSYYAQFNRPSFRGRLYLPLAVIGGGAAALRPSAGQIGAALLWATILGEGMPAGTFWTVYSGVKNSDAKVTNAWVDNEWDTVRSRGMRGDTRQLHTVP